MKKILILIIMLLFASIAFAQSIEITGFEENILVEKGWVRYLSIDVENTGDVALNNVQVLIDGEKSSWFEAQDEAKRVQPGETAAFLFKLYVPAEEENGSFDFSLRAVSDEVTTWEDFSVEIFASRTDSLLSEIQDFSDQLISLKSEANGIAAGGSDVSEIRAQIDEATLLLEAASSDVYGRLYDEAGEKIREVEVIVKKAEYDLSIAETSPVTQAKGISFETILILALIIIIIAMFLWFFVLGRNKKSNITPGSIPGLKIKRLIRREKQDSKVDDEIRSLEEAKGLLEEEYREGLISRHSYEEMRTKYEEKILNLSTKSAK
ncbi:MAG: hypothetical protein JW700_02730 [Candidatus Aenigmarchaeota archaeon]|nr:hypothetical protein [Candidatus Aenigmarchaeota archaeon]